jgi:hypothetical protein
MKHFEVIKGNRVIHEDKNLFTEEWRMELEDFLEKYKDHRIWINSFGPGFVRAIVYKDVKNFMHLLGA